MTPEGRLVAAIRRDITRRGGICRKCAWEGVAGAPDLLVMMHGRHIWLECKAPGEKPRPLQIREHDRMRSMGGCIVYVVDNLQDYYGIMAKEGLYE